MCVCDMRGTVCVYIRNCVVYIRVNCTCVLMHEHMFVHTYVHIPCTKSPEVIIVFVLDC